MLPKLFSFSLLQLKLQEQKVLDIVQLLDNDNVLLDRDNKEFLGLIVQELSQLIWEEVGWPVKPENLTDGQISQDGKDREIFTVVFQG